MPALESPRKSFFTHAALFLTTPMATAS
jgi:hypothetical protein